MRRKIRVVGAMIEKDGRYLVRIPESVDFLTACACAAGFQQLIARAVAKIVDQKFQAPAAATKPASK